MEERAVWFRILALLALSVAIFFNIMIMLAQHSWMQDPPAKWQSYNQGMAIGFAGLALAGAIAVLFKYVLRVEPSNKQRNIMACIVVVFAALSFVAGIMSIVGLNVLPVV